MGQGRCAVLVTIDLSKSFAIAACQPRLTITPYASEPQLRGHVALVVRRLKRPRVARGCRFVKRTARPEYLCVQVLANAPEIKGTEECRIVTVGGLDCRFVFETHGSARRAGRPHGRAAVCPRALSLLRCGATARTGTASVTSLGRTLRRLHLRESYRRRGRAKPLCNLT